MTCTCEDRIARDVRTIKNILIGAALVGIGWLCAPIIMWVLAPPLIVLQKLPQWGVWAAWGAFCVGMAISDYRSRKARVA